MAVKKVKKALRKKKKKGTEGLPTLEKLVFPIPIRNSLTVPPTKKATFDQS